MKDFRQWLGERSHLTNRDVVGFYTLGLALGLWVGCLAAWGSR